MTTLSIGGKAITATATQLNYVAGVTSAIQTQLNAKEPTISAGTTAQYWRGDKTWQTLASAPVSSVFGRTGAVTAASGDYSVGNITGAAPLASPTFTGTPVAPTAAAGTNTTQLATTAFVTTAMASGVPSGVIVMWSGTLATIPTGWKLCDGTSGTPDLRDKFIYGTSAGVNPGGTGGSTTHSHTITNREVFLGPLYGSSCTPAGGGKLRIGLRYGGTTTYNRLEWQDYAQGEWSPGLLYEYYVTGALWSGCVGLQVLNLDSDAVATMVTALPPYYKLAYIMKL